MLLFGKNPPKNLFSVFLFVLFSPSKKPVFFLVDIRDKGKSPQPFDIHAPSIPTRKKKFPVATYKENFSPTPRYPQDITSLSCGYPRYKFFPSDIHEEKSVLALLGARFFPRGYPRGKTYTSDSHKAMGDILWISRGGKKISVLSKSVDIDVLKMSKGYWKTLENQDISH